MEICEKCALDFRKPLYSGEKDGTFGGWKLIKSPMEMLGEE
jgi:hypothetical protein